MPVTSSQAATQTARLAKRRLLAVLLVSPFMAQADATIANVATPSIQAHLGASGAALELVVAGYLVTFAMLLITGARLGETYGYRRMLLAGISVFSLASLVCGLAPNPGVLIGARVVQGAGAALMFPQTLTGIQLNFAGIERARAIGSYAVALSVGAITGQILGGVLVSANLAGSHWRAIFLVNIPVGVATAIAATRYLPSDEPRSSRRLDAVGVATLSAGVLLLVLPLALGHVEGWSTWIWACVAASAPMFVLFLKAQRREAAAGGSPLVNIDALARSAVSWALLALFVTSATYFALLFTLAQYLQQGLGHSALISGVTLVPWVAAFGAAGQLAGRVPSKLMAFLPAAGCSLLATSYVAISGSLFGTDHGQLLLVTLLGIGGFGLGIQFSSLLGHLSSAVPGRYAADISGVSSTTSQVGGALGVAGFGTVYLGQAHTSPAQATHAFAVATAAFAIAAAFAVFASHRGARPSPTAVPAAVRELATDQSPQ
jgi:predicted MFS family arabinose efflux permease